MIKYNEHGVAVSEPWKVIEWKEKTNHITIDIFLDGLYYYALHFFYKDGGVSFGLSKTDTGFPTLEKLKDHVLAWIIKYDPRVEGTAKKLLKPEQGELF